MKTTTVLAIVTIGVICWPAEVSQAVPMGTAFTYQGRLMDGNKPADGLYDFQFKLYDGPADGNQLGSTLDVNELDAIEGYFTIGLDFGGGIFDGNAVWLEIAVRPGDPCDFVTLSPRQEVMPVPYALYAASGKPGPQGLQGEQGAAGPQGPVGQDGADGAAGPQGPAGQDGADGAAGAEGPEGAAGQDGADGAAGADGAEGPAGRDGADGATGPEGPAGDSHWKLSDTKTYYNNGNVGIGTTNPQSKLSVGGNGMANTGVYGSGSDTGVYGEDSTSGAYGRLGYGATSVWGAGSNYGVIGEGTIYGVKGTDSDTGAYGRLGNDTWGGYFGGDGYFSGNVGIGTSDPVSKLEVKGRLELPAKDASGTRGTGAIEIGNSLRLDDNEIITNTDEPLFLQRDNNGDLSVDDGTLTVDADRNRVGIGTNPDHGKLEVNGEISTGHEGLRWKVFLGKTGSDEVIFSHGLNANHICSISCVLRSGANGVGVAQEVCRPADGSMSFSIGFDKTNVVIRDIGDGFDDADDTYRCIVWYIDS